MILFQRTDVDGDTVQLVDAPPATPESVVVQVVDSDGIMLGILLDPDAATDFAIALLRAARLERL